MSKELFTYQMYADSVYFATKKAKSESDAIAQVKEQIKHLHPLNMSNEGVIKYRKKYENSIITAKKLY